MSAPNITSPSRHGTQVCRRVAGPRAGASVPWLRCRAPPFAPPWNSQTLPGRNPGPGEM
ncbi:hypothetical protein GQ607_015712 [Colletotrichum asianum]|uniref:Uncharacterized protein n=1 Tax=Colletotrichum asianum TaxID=702518 RepID=A0A8H3W0G7_9PEZI|nr:hypothetical protein GQ607_015712 [Colletotrichum asianum]